jgi:HK97 family phage major capsid protein
MRRNPEIQYRKKVTDMTIEEQLSAAVAEQKKFHEKASDEQKAHGTMLTETKESLTKLQTQVDALDVKLAQKHIADQGQGPTLVKSFRENESIQRLLKDRSGKAVIQIKGNEVAELMERKTIISNITSGSAGTDTLNPVGAATSGVLQIDRIPGITPEARQALKIRDLFSQRPTTMQVVDYVKVSNPMAIASPVPEASVKPENSLSFVSQSEKVRLLATWIPATRQVLDDFTELMSFIQSAMPYYVNLEEELQLLAGDNTGENLHGLLSQASAFSTALLPSAAKGWNKIDVIATAIKQINAAKEIEPTFAVISTNDWWDIRLTKDGFGRYILGDPQIAVRPNIFGLDVVPTTSIAQGTFLVGSGSPVAAEIRDRMEMQIEISTEHSDYFVRNLVAIRAEKRLALVTKRVNSFVQGSFTTSP